MISAARWVYTHNVVWMPMSVIMWLFALYLWDLI